MSIKRTVEVWDKSQHSGSTLLALLSLADRADENGFCWPSHTDTAKRARVSRTYIAATIIPKLIDTGELYQVKKRGYSSRYIVLEGLSAEQIKETMLKKLKMSKDEIAEELQFIASKMNGSGRDVQSFDMLKDLTGVLKDLTGGVNTSEHEPSITEKESSIKLQAGQPETEEIDLFSKPKVKPVSKKKNTRDPRIDHPAIKGFCSITRKHIPIVWRDEVIKVVGSDAEKWLKLIRDWVGLGWNPTNVKGMLEAFSNGGLKPKPNNFNRSDADVMRAQLEREGVY